MSETRTPQIPEPVHFRQEPDPSHNPRAIRIGVVTAVIFCGGVLWAWRTLVSREKLLLPDGPIATPIEAAEHREEIGLVFQTQFDDKSWPAENRRKEDHLRNYGWTDRKNNRIHIPIEKAMDLVAAGRSQ